MSCTHFASSPSSSSRQLPLQQLQHDLRTRALIFVRCFGVILSNIDFKPPFRFFRAVKKPPSSTSTAHFLPSVYIITENRDFLRNSATTKTSKTQQAVTLENHRCLRIIEYRILVRTELFDFMSALSPSFGTFAMIE